MRRRQRLSYLTKQEAVGVAAMEARASAHYWGREIESLGHRVVLLPPQHVKGYLRGQKKDYNDAVAIAGACQHNRIRSVAIKTLAQQDEQSFHGIRRSLTADKVRLGKQLRGLLSEYGLAVSKGDAALRHYLEELRGEDDERLTPRAQTYLARQYARFLALLEELAWYGWELRDRVNQDEVCTRLQEAPLFGVVPASVVKHWMGDGPQFGCRRDASAALGLVPRQHSTGGKERLGASASAAMRS